MTNEMGPNRLGEEFLHEKGDSPSDVLLDRGPS